MFQCDGCKKHFDDSVLEFSLCPKCFTDVDGETRLILEAIQANIENLTKIVDRHEGRIYGKTE